MIEILFALIIIILLGLHFKNQKYIVLSNYKESFNDIEITKCDGSY